MADVDYLVVGAGIAGLTCAQVLAEAGKRVVCIDKRPYIGGNCADSKIPVQASARKPEQSVAGQLHTKFDEARWRHQHRHC